VAATLEAVVTSLVKWLARAFAPIDRCGCLCVDLPAVLVWGSERFGLSILATCRARRPDALQRTT
jgi:hypothetical protein